MLQLDMPCDYWQHVKLMAAHNMALNLAPFGRWTLRENRAKIAGSQNRGVYLYSMFSSFFFKNKSHPLRFLGAGGFFRR